MDSKYDKQARGGSSAYAEYFGGMDKSMAQKVAYVSAYLPTRGILADMGSGSGKGSYDLARLFTDLHIVGVDIAKEATQYAAQTHKLPNLEFKQGDIAEENFPESSLDAIVNSSVLHHVTSFNNFQLQKIYRLLDNQTRSLKEGGVLVIRDFVAPDSDKEVLLELPQSDGYTEKISTAELFEKFCRTFKCAAYRNSNIPFRKISETDNTATYRVSLRPATEFMLRKDYRKDWDVELLEEYLYFSRVQFEEEFHRRNLRILLSKPIVNDWIIENRWQGKVRLFDIDGAEIGFPPTNYVIVGEKVSPDQGVVIRESSSEALEIPSFLKLEHFRHSGTGAIWDLVSRPHQTIDIVPWFRDAGEIFIVGRSRYPRPIINSKWKDAPLGAVYTSGYVNEPITAVLTTGKITPEFIKQTMLERAGILAEHIQNISSDELIFYPSPGGVDEVVNSCLVEIKPQWEFTAPKPIATETIRAFHAQQLLRTAQIGGMLDARLELNLYQLFLNENVPLDPWIGVALPLSKTPSNPLSQEPMTSSAIKRPFETTDETNKSPNVYLTIRHGHFEELRADDTVIKTWDLEYVLPKVKSTNTLLALAVGTDGKTSSLLIEERELPIAQKGFGNAVFWDMPGWRLPKNITNEHGAMLFLRERMRGEHGISVSSIKLIDGTYMPSTGTTPEAVMFAALSLEDNANLPKNLFWVPLDELLKKRKEIRDGHLLIALFRAAHALGLNN